MIKTDDNLIDIFYYFIRKRLSAKNKKIFYNFVGIE